MFGHIIHLSLRVVSLVVLLFEALLGDARVVTVQPALSTLRKLHELPVSWGKPIVKMQILVFGSHAALLMNVFRIGDRTIVLGSEPAQVETSSHAG